MATPPPPEAEAALLAPTSSLVRRIEIYEADGTTQWSNGDHDGRLIGGSVSIDYSRPERRTFDLTLDNSDFGIQHDPDGFWYDKIIKIYYGVHYVSTAPLTSYVVRTNLFTNPNVEVDLAGWSWSESTVTRSNAWATNGTYSALINSATVNNDSFASIGGDAGAMRLGMQAGKTYTVSADINTPVAQTGTLSDRARCIVLFTKAGAASAVATKSTPGPTTGTARIVFTFTIPVGTTEAWIRLYNGGANSSVNSVYWDSVLVEEGTTQGLYYDGNSSAFANRVYAWTGTANASTSTETTTVKTPTAQATTWETQVGEFMIDSISEDHFPHVVKVNGRDYTKKLLLSKFNAVTAFASGYDLETAIWVVAYNAGIRKFILPVTGKKLGKDFFFERNSECWKAIDDMASAFGYEVFFDARGYLNMREYQDPVVAPLAYTLETGTSGNLVSYTKTTNDTRIYNHIVVTGESSDPSVIPVSAEATNTEPSSPTRVAKLGDRVYPYSSPFITTTAQALDLAQKYLKIMSLEEFSLSFSSITLPWLEVGEIIQFNDPREFAGQPTRFLLASITLPLDLGPMSGSAKRVSVVG